MNEIVNIILPVHNRKEITEKFLKLLKNQTSQNIHLILVDDGSTDGTSSMTLGYFPNATILKGDGNLWWAGSLDIGRKWLLKNKDDKDEIVLIINDDVLISETYIENSLSEFKTCGDSALYFTPSYSKQTKDMVEVGVHYDKARVTFRCTDNADKVNCLSTRGLFLRLKDFERIGSFYPKILPHYLSDYEYTVRAYQMGFRLIVSKNVHLFVDESTTGHHKEKFYEFPFKKFMSHFFSIRHTGNPVFFYVFVLLRNKGIWFKIIGLFRVTKGSLGYIRRYFQHRKTSVEKKI